MEVSSALAPGTVIVTVKYLSIMLLPQSPKAAVTFIVMTTGSVLGLTFVVLDNVLLDEEEVQ